MIPNSINPNHPVQTEKRVVNSESVQPKSIEIVMNEDNKDGRDAITEKVDSVETTIWEQPKSVHKIDTSDAADENAVVDRYIPRGIRKKVGLTVDLKLPQCERIYQISVKEGLRCHKPKATQSIIAELTQIYSKKVISGVK